MKSYVLAFIHICPCRKIGQGQLNVIIWTILVVLWYPMQHNLSSSKAISLLVLERKKFFTIYGHGSYLGHVIRLICINFHTHSPIRFQMKFDYK